jgi:glucuronoarabinoxylan endo-1,4-beta-xylanase
MAATPYRSGPVALDVIAVNVAVGPTTIDNIVVDNTSGSARTFSLSVGASSSSDELYTDRAVSGSFQIRGPFTLGAGEFMQALASGPGVTITLNGSTTATVGAADFIVDKATPLVTVKGFGACDRNYGQNGAVMTSAQADLFFDVNLGIGLSLLRISIEPDGTPTSSLTDVSLAAARGAQVWAAPWSPLAAWKDNGSTTNGGHLLLAHYDDWATVLANFVGVVKSGTGVDLYAVSVQNEPDFSAPYDSCIYTSTEMTNFIKVLAPKLQALSPAPLLLCPEPSQWSLLDGYVSVIAGDSTALADVGVFATHDYGYDPVVVNVHGKPLWETEVSSFDAATRSMSNALTVAGWIHNAFVVGNVAAWHYWRLWQPTEDDNESLIFDALPNPKRLYALGNYSKLVRPGFQRFAVSGSISGLSVTGFTLSGKTVIVVINNNGSPTTATFHASAGGSVATPWRTSATEDLVSLAPLIALTGQFSATLAASSVTTFVVQ